MQVASELVFTFKQLILGAIYIAYYKKNSILAKSIIS